MSEPRTKVSDEDMEQLEMALVDVDSGACMTAHAMRAELLALRVVAAAARDVYEATQSTTEAYTLDLGKALTKAGY